MFVEITEWTVLVAGKAWDLDVLPLGSANLSVNQSRDKCYAKVKVGVLRPVQQPGSYWDRSSELPLVGLETTEVTAYD